MSGNKQANNTNGMIDQHLGSTDQNQNNFQQSNDARTSQVEGGVSEDRSGTQAAIGDQASKVNTVANRDYSTNYTPNYSASSAGYKSFMDNGGVDTSQMGGGNSTLKDQMNNGDIANNFRANGTYAEYAKTGGLSEGDKANIMARDTSGVPAMYSRLNDESNRLASVQGGYNPGGLAMKARMARDQAGSISDATRNATMDITNQVNQGRQWGASGMTNAESGYQGMRQGAATNLNADEARTQGMIQQGKMFGTSGQFGVDNATNQMGYDQSQANAGRMFGQDTAVMSGAGAVTGANQTLLNTDANRESDLYGLDVYNRQTGQSGDQSMINSRIANNPRRDYLSPLISGGAGVAEAFA